MNLNYEWSGLADFLANMIEKYAGQMNLDELPDPDRYYKMKQMKDMYRIYLQLSVRARQVT